MEIVQKAPVVRTADPYRDTDVIDARAPRFNQTVVAVTSIVALLTGAWWITALMGAQLAIGLTFGRRFCLPCLAYFELVQPRFGEGPIEDSRPPRFANILGATFLISASLLHAIGSNTIGWVLIAAVAALASLAVVTGFCMGCSVYRVLSRVRGVRPGHHVRLDVGELDAAGASVVQFTHPLCSDCKELADRLRNSGETVALVDVSRRPDLALKYHIDVVPLALRITSGGEVTERLA